MSFSGKVVFVTGGTLGIGLETARQFSQQGAHVAIFSRRRNPASVNAVALARRSRNQIVRHYKADITDADQLRISMSRAASEIGPPTILVNSAGIGLACQFDLVSAQTFNHVIQTNLIGSRNAVEAVLPLMHSQPNCSIVMIGSIASFIPAFGLTAFSASKFGVLGLAQSLRYELKQRGIHVACYCPSQVRTPSSLSERFKNLPLAYTVMKSLTGTLSTKVAVRSLIRGIQKRQVIIIPGFRAKLLYMAFQVTPALLWNAISDIAVSRLLAVERARRTLP